MSGLALYEVRYVEQCWDADFEAGLVCHEMRSNE